MGKTGLCRGLVDRSCLRFCSLILYWLTIAAFSFAQMETATLSGTVMDHSGAVVVGAQVQVTNSDTNVTAATNTNKSGVYVVPSLRPGRYRIAVTKPGFKQVVVTDVVLNVQDTVNRNFNLDVGAASESITVTADQLTVNTTDASVSTVVDQKFVANMPLNGRSFQDLLTLAPGVTQVPSIYSGPGASGEISVNGQRTEANYFTVDGVSANTGTALSNSIFGAGYSGSTPAETVLGTTQSLVSIDALQEFRATTSSYSAQYGRTPGGQFSLSTRSGANQWHGSAYEYFRNDAMDANNWFSKCACLGLPLTPRLPERQNDFGGTLSGPIIVPGIYDGRDKTFFFFSYEGLRLVVPQTPAIKTFVPDQTLRQQSPIALQPFLKAFALPNGGEDGLNDGLAIYNLVYSAPSSLDSISARVDHNVSDKLKIFARYADTPSNGWVLTSAAKNTSEINVRTLTLGASSVFTASQANDLRFNITQNNAILAFDPTNAGGATPLDIASLPGPNGQPLNPVGTELTFILSYGGFPNYSLGTTRNQQRQYNLTDTYTWSVHNHQLQFGADWRRLSTFIVPIVTGEIGEFFSEASVLANSADFAGNFPFTTMRVVPVYNNYSAFIQDEWKASHRLALSLGVRWDVNPAPGNLNGSLPYTLDQITNLATAKLAPAGTPLWQTDWRGLVPRLGLAYSLRESNGHETVLRAGFGVFNDTGNAQGSIGFQAIGFVSRTLFTSVPFPLTSDQLTLPPPSIAPPYGENVIAFDPHLKLPHTLQWNVALEQALGKNQSATLNYVGSAGRRLLVQFEYVPAALGNPNFGPFVGAVVTSNRSTSDYAALQAKYERRLSHGFQALASYTWSHSIDEASSNFQLFELLRGSSDFDVRHNFQAAMTYDVPGSYANSALSAVLRNWSLQTRVSARSAFPVDILLEQSVDPITQKLLSFHPNVVPGQPLYLYGSQYPGRRIVNCHAFLKDSACDVNNPVNQLPPGVDGNAGRNSARGFNAVQVNLAFQREFRLEGPLHLQFRTEAFNLLNHPIFGTPYNYLSFGPQLFGYASGTLSGTLGGLNSLYQSGGPRSLQISLRLSF